MDPKVTEATALLLRSMFCNRAPSRREHSFFYNKPGLPVFGFGGAGFEVFYDSIALARAALFMRKNGAPHLGSLSVGDVENALQNFVSDNFWIIGSEAWDGCLCGAGRTSDVSYDRFVSNGAKQELAKAMRASDLFTERKETTIFPLVVVRVEHDFEREPFFLISPKSLRAELLPKWVEEAELVPTEFPPTKGEGVRQRPASWLGVNAGTAEIAKRMRAAVLGSVALLPHHFERYMFTGRRTFGGRFTFTNSAGVFSPGESHTPALSEDVLIGPADEAWLELLARKIVSPQKDDKRQMRALEYFYRAWVPDESRRFPTLFASLDAVFGDAGRATQSVIDAIGPMMGDAYDYDRLKLLLNLRASVVHGGAPNVYESSAYQKYYERYDEDAVRDLQLIVPNCLRAVIFDGAMAARPHTHARLIKERTGRDV